MRFLFTSTAYPPATGGAQVHLQHLAGILSQRHAVQVASYWNRNRTDWLLGTTLRTPPRDCNEVQDAVPVRRIGYSWREKARLAPYVLLYYPLMRAVLPRMAAITASHLSPLARQADLIHNLRVGREGLSYASLLAARQLAIPFIFTPHHHPRWVGWRYQAYLDLYRQADMLVALTQSEKKVLSQFGVREERVIVTGIGPVLAAQADAEDFRSRQQITGPCVLFLGQQYAYKGYRQLLQAAGRVWQRHPDTHFVFIGPAVGRSYQELAAWGDRRIHNLGLVDLQTKTDALAACTLLCVPSTQESFGGVYTEAWALGKPVIGCPIPAVSEVIEDGRDGFLTPQNAAAIAGRIIELLDNPAQAQALGAAGRRKVEERYSWERLARIYESACQELLHG